MYTSSYPASALSVGGVNQGRTTSPKKLAGTAPQGSRAAWGEKISNNLPDALLHIGPCQLNHRTLTAVGARLCERPPRTVQVQYDATSCAGLQRLLEPKPPTAPSFPPALLLVVPGVWPTVRTPAPLPPALPPCKKPSGSSCTCRRANLRCGHRAARPPPKR